MSFLWDFLGDRTKAIGRTLMARRQTVIVDDLNHPACFEKSASLGDSSLPARSSHPLAAKVVPGVRQVGRRNTEFISQRTSGQIFVTSHGDGLLGRPLFGKEGLALASKRKLRSVRSKTQLKTERAGCHISEGILNRVACAQAEHLRSSSSYHGLRHLRGAADFPKSNPTSIERSASNSC
jgi:hypothetical protein